MTNLEFTPLVFVFRPVAVLLDPLIGMGAAPLVAFEVGRSQPEPQFPLVSRDPFSVESPSPSEKVA